MNVWNSDIAPSLYQALVGDSSFRLLLIYPGETSEPLRTKLIPTTLDEAQGRYDATSYTWGSPENPVLINCNGLRLWVQRNAFDMMLDLRQTDQPRKVWIDAICINQCSLDERAAQVSIMHQIYRRAGSVSVWLGCEDEYSSTAMAFAATLDTDKLVKEFSYCEYGSNWARFAEKSYFFDPSSNLGVDADLLKDQAVAIVNFLNRPWYSRVWIQQEASLCSNTRVVCGPNTVGWDNIFALAWVMCPRYTETWPDYIHQKLSRTINNIQAVRIIQRARHYYFQDTYGRTDTSLSFERMVEFVSRYEATDPRDRIYAMGNIVADSKDWFEVDYRIPWQILYIDVARRFLDVDALSFLKNAGRVRQESDTVLPSWAPDYRYREESGYMISRATLWRAGGNSNAAYIPSSSKSNSRVSPLPKNRRRRTTLPDELQAFKGSRKSLLQSFASIRCLMSDEIVYVGGLIDNENDGLEVNVQRIVENIQKDVDYITNLKVSAYFNGDGLLDAYKLTLIMSCDAKQEIVHSDYVREHWEEWLEWHKHGCPGYWKSDFEAPAMNPSFESSGVMKTFRFAVTKHGCFCLVPRMARIGDEIGIFQNYELALVLRQLPPPSLPANKGAQQQTPATSDPPYFELLGDAYVHGLMENEARCIIDEFDCRYEPTQAQWNKMLEASEGGRGEAWKTLDLDGQYERILKTLGLRTLRLV
ncbi:hypothetical protein F5Y19DRAFT_445920 [Xylariaceae sp. FL1651]|nr:hypothetical protein F5Y19DRAFT_445920 [Xylariaceae sp. FL1651]